MENNKDIKIGIVGLGLIGGSILKSLSEKGYYTIAVSKSSADAAQKYADVTSYDMEVLKEANAVFVCSKMRDTIKILEELESIVGPGTVVTDVCSLKEFVNKKPRLYNFVASHPMAGTEFFGFEHSFSKLFIGAKWVINENNILLETLIKDMGAKPLVIDERNHDRLAGVISHLPMLVSFALFAIADGDAKKIAASGFRDMTRLAMTNSDLAYDMLDLNSENIDRGIDELCAKLKQIKNMPKDDLISTLDFIANERKNMYDEDGKNIF